MADLKFFTDCWVKQGETAQLAKAQYVPANRLFQYGLTEPAKSTARYIQSCGGGRPTLYSYAVGRCALCSLHHVALRIIERPSNASNHKCDARCQNAQGRKCECSCRGKNHGAN